MSEIVHCALMDEPQITGVAMHTKSGLSSVLPSSDLNKIEVKESKNLIKIDSELLVLSFQPQQ